MLDESVSGGSRHQHLLDATAAFDMWVPAWHPWFLKRLKCWSDVLMSFQHQH
jgi:hypothetical protein